MGTALAGPSPCLPPLFPPLHLACPVCMGFIPGAGFLAQRDTGRVPDFSFLGRDARRARQHGTAGRRRTGRRAAPPGTATAQPAPSSSPEWKGAAPRGPSWHWCSCGEGLASGGVRVQHGPQGHGLRVRRRPLLKWMTGGQGTLPSTTSQLRATLQQQGLGARSRNGFPKGVRARPPPPGPQARPHGTSGDRRPEKRWISQGSRSSWASLGDEAGS